MPVNLKEFDSVGGFSIDKTTIVDDDRNAKNINTIQIQNSNFTDSSKTNYILRGSDTSILSLNTAGGQIILPSNTINFITGHIIGVNQTGGGSYSLKLESTVLCNEIGSTQVLSTLETIIKDSIPTGQTWQVSIAVGGSPNNFSYSVVKGGSEDPVKWVASIEVISITWI
jgi:hypothetical protein